MEICEIQRVYRRLRDAEASLAGAVPAPELAQAGLDFLAMAAGLKPVFLAGRGLDAPAWLAAIGDLAGELGFHVLTGPLWDATPFGKFPGWYRDHALAPLAPLRAVYVCPSDETAREVADINAGGGRLAMTTEARLLGYPDCCVVAHYNRAVHYHNAVFAILNRLARGDAARMQALLTGGAALAPKTDREIADMEAAFDLHPAPFGSWNRCPFCARTDDSPSARLSHRYEALARRIDPALAEALEIAS